MCAGGVIIANTLIGVVQELRAKRTLDRLAIIGETKPLVRRDGRTHALAPSELVLDDVVELGPGDQIVVDGVIVAADGLEVDESLLTGEADPVRKAPGDPVMSGSFVVAGGAAMTAIRVGREAYAAQLAAEASRFTLVNSQLRSSPSTPRTFRRRDAGWLPAWCRWCRKVLCCSPPSRSRSA